MRYRPDPSWWRHSRTDGETVVGGSPPRIFRFTAAASRFLDAIESGADLDSSTVDLQRRLVDAGALHPVIGPRDTISSHRIPSLADVTIIIPAHVDDPAPVRHLVEHAPDVAATIVVDDGSATPLFDIPRARIIRHDAARGPAAARNRALDLVDTDFVLFVDHDIRLPSEARTADFWHPLMVLLADPRTALVAPRVRSTPGRSVRERYEGEHSPLDMGSIPARVAPGSRLSYVPSACVLVRMQVLRELHGFDESLRYGEDVDFVWRANESGHTCRYEPSVAVEHAPRSSWSELLEQRFRYGTAAAPLDSRHPGSTRPFRTSRWSAASLAAAVTGHPVVACGITAVSAVRLAQRLQSMPDRWLVASHLVGRGQLSALRAFLDSCVRTWWPITAITCLVSRRARTIVGMYLTCRALSPVVRRSRGRDVRGRDIIAPLDVDMMDHMCSASIHVVDDIAYGSGVWWGAWMARDPSCLAPRFD